MLSEEQMYHAKVFIRSYGDAFACLKESARKQATVRHYTSFYTQLGKSQEAKEITVDEDKVSTGPSFQDSYFHRLFKFSRKEVGHYFKTHPTSAEELGQQLDAMTADLRKRVSEARQRSSS
jgi:hypothetical protein